MSHLEYDLPETFENVHQTLLYIFAGLFLQNYQSGKTGTEECFIAFSGSIVTQTFEKKLKLISALSQTLVFKTDGKITGYTTTDYENAT